MRRVWAAVSVVGLVLLLAAVAAHPARATVTPTPSDALVASGESWPEYTVRQLENNATSAGAIGSLSPTYVAGRGEDPSRQDFAAGLSDMAVVESPLTSDESATATQNGITPAYVPFGIGSVAIVATVALPAQCGGPGFVTGLHLTLGTLARIMTHQIVNWNDPRILAENPNQCGLIHPAGPGIQIVVRQDSSSTTAALANAFLADPVAKPIWEAYASQQGQDPQKPTDVWPADPNVNTVGTIAGSRGVINTMLNIDPVTQQPIPGIGFNYVGYVGYEWAKQYNLPLVAIENAASPPTYVLPTGTNAISAAMSSATFDSTTNLYSIDYTKLTATGAYPIPLVGYFVVPVAGATPGKAQPLANFIRYALGTAGQADVSATGLLPPPASVITAGLHVADELQASATTTTTSTSTSTSSSTSTTSSTTSTTAARGSSTTAAGRAVTAAATGTGSTPVATDPTNSNAQLATTGGAPSLWLAGIGLALVAVGQLGRRRRWWLRR